MLKVGLSGGIGCGKSEASNCFKEHGVPVIDADLIAQQLTERNSPQLNAIVKAFGKQILNTDDSLNRKALRQLIFDHADKRKRLNAIIHPKVREHIVYRLEKLHAPYCVIVAPLLLETGMQNIVDCIVIMDCPIAMRIERIAKRDYCNVTEAKKIIASQYTRKKSLEAADIIVDNSKDKQHLKETIEKLHRKFLCRLDKK